MKDKPKHSNGSRSNIHRYYIIQTLLHHIPGLFLMEKKDLSYYYLLELKHVTLKRKKK